MLLFLSIGMGILYPLFIPRQWTNFLSSSFFPSFGFRPGLLPLFCIIPLPMDIDPHPVSFYNTFMKLLHFEFVGVPPFFGGFFRPDHDPPRVF